jgi:hypothetical protein
LFDNQSINQNKYLILAILDYIFSSLSVAPPPPHLHLPPNPVVAVQQQHTTVGEHRQQHTTVGEHCWRADETVPGKKVQEEAEVESATTPMEHSRLFKQLLVACCESCHRRASLLPMALPSSLAAASNCLGTKQTTTITAAAADRTEEMPPLVVAPVMGVKPSETCCGCNDVSGGDNYNDNDNAGLKPPPPAECPAIQRRRRSIQLILGKQYQQQQAAVVGDEGTVTVAAVAAADEKHMPQQQQRPTTTATETTGKVEKEKRLMEGETAEEEKKVEEKDAPVNGNDNDNKELEAKVGSHREEEESSSTTMPPVAATVTPSATAVAAVTFECSEENKAEIHDVSIRTWKKKIGESEQQHINVQKRLKKSIFIITDSC